MKRLSGIVIYGCPYLFEKIKKSIHKNIPLAYSPSQTEEAQNLRVIREAEADGSEVSWRETRNTMELLQVELDELRLQIARRRRLLFLSTCLLYTSPSPRD